jgi:hypothetical protein
MRALKWPCKLNGVIKYLEGWEDVVTRAFVRGLIKIPGRKGNIQLGDLLHQAEACEGGV